MTEKSILPSPLMVQAILGGRKTQMREVVKSRHKSGLFQVEYRKVDGVITGITSLDWKEHFDVCLTKKALAIKHGAKEITWRELGTMMQKRPGHPSYKKEERLISKI